MAAATKGCFAPGKVSYDSMLVTLYEMRELSLRLLCTNGFHGKSESSRCHHGGPGAVRRDENRDWRKVFK